MGDPYITPAGARRGAALLRQAAESAADRDGTS